MEPPPLQPGTRLCLLSRVLLSVLPCLLAPTPVQR
jgi:hypothetical protein